MRRLLALPLLLLAAPSAADDLKASDPVKLDVTIYRDPYRDSGSIELDNLGGFAVITETRRVTIPAGKHRLRFEGVVDGIIPESAIITGLPGGVIEKNQDADLLSPSALLRAARGRVISLTRTDPATGKQVRVPAEIVSASEDGVVFKSKQGTESLRCSGMPETFRYDTTLSGIPARPTLSVQTRSPRAVEATVTLTYVAEQFDWGANYTMKVNDDGKTVDFGGWITLANGNSVSLEKAQVRVVAGKLNREDYERLTGPSEQVVAKCWPMQTTSDIPEKPGRPYQLVRPDRFTGNAYLSDEIVVSAQLRREAMMSAATPVTVVSADSLEQLGDLKLYRLPYPSTVAARQMKQVRLIDLKGVAYERVFWVDAAIDSDRSDVEWEHPALTYSLRNDKAHGLGLPIPSGSYLIQQDQFGLTMVVDETGGRDRAVGEVIGIAGPENSDLSWRQRLLEVRQDGKRVIRSYVIEVRNASARPAVFWVTPDGAPNLVRASSLPLVSEQGRQRWRLEVPANGAAQLSFSAVSD